jgi:hypothetical protein
LTQEQKDIRNQAAKDRRADAPKKARKKRKCKNGLPRGSDGKCLDKRAVGKLMRRNQP